MGWPPIACIHHERQSTHELPANTFVRFVVESYQEAHRRASSTANQLRKASVFCPSRRMHGSHERHEKHEQEYSVRDRGELWTCLLLYRHSSTVVCSRVQSHCSRFAILNLKSSNLCFDQIIVQLKAVKEITSEHQAQVLNYLRATEKRLGLLVNFGAFPKATVQRLVLQELLLTSCPATGILNRHPSPAAAGGGRSHATIVCGLRLPIDRFAVRYRRMTSVPNSATE